MTTTTPKSKRQYRPRRRVWTRQEYERLTALGIFGPDERLELIAGEIVKKMPQNGPHATGITLMVDALRPILPEDHYIRSQMPLAISDLSEPEPDVAVVAGVARDYRNAHPMTAALVVEVSDSTLHTDRVTKAALYARALIPEYWIININERQLEVHRQPGPMRAHLLGHYYYVVSWHDETQTIAPLFSPHAAIAIADLLP